jgi:hypothetical protein
MKKFFKKISEKFGNFWWLHIGYPIYMRKLGKKTKKDLIDLIFIEIDID